VRPRSDVLVLVSISTSVRGADPYYISSSSIPKTESTNIQNEQWFVAVMVNQSHRKFHRLIE